MLSFDLKLYMQNKSLNNNLQFSRVILGKETNFYPPVSFRYTPSFHEFNNPDHYFYNQKTFRRV